MALRLSGTRPRLLALALSALVVGASLTMAGSAVQAADRNVTFTVDGNDLDTNPADAWKGFGAVTANNTSRLLLDYKSEHPAVLEDHERLVQPGHRHGPDAGQD